MPKYHKRPIEVEATQWFKMGDHPGVIECWYSGDRINICQCGYLFSEHGKVALPTYKTTIVHPGDWIVTDPNGEISVVKDSEFREMYEVVEESYHYEKQRKLPAIQTPSDYKRAE